MMGNIKRNCNCCNKEYLADERNLKRGCGLTCSKSCAAQMREKAKPNYDHKRVANNNIRRALWNEKTESIRPMNTLATGKFQGYTSEGYRIFGGIAFDEFDEEVYVVDKYEDANEHGQWND